MSNSLTADVLEALKPRPGVNVLITAGNSFRRDDGVGPYIASKLDNNHCLKICDAGQTPENITDEVIAFNPSNIIVIDAANFQGFPGEVRIIPEHYIPETTLSTHMIPLNVVTKIIQDSSQVPVTFIGIQPKNVNLGETLCSEVKASADELIAVIKQEFTTKN